MYSIKEIFYSIQGEGYHAGRPVVLCRFSGCNLWSGREEERSKSICKFCDTDFVGTDGINGGVYRSSAELAHRISLTWPVRKNKSVRPFVVCTGGEPLLQLDHALISDLHEEGFAIAVETNGTIPIKCYLPVDWITCSPKFDFCPHAELRLQRIDELKVVYQGQDMTAYDGIEAKEYYLQPCDFKDEARNSENIAATINYIKSHPKWKLSLQTQKILSVR